MKLTGIVILIVGLVIGLVTMIQFFGANPGPGSEEVNATGWPTVQLIFAGLGIIVGTYLLATGGSGVVESRDPAVRN